MKKEGPMDDDLRIELFDALSRRAGTLKQLARLRAPTHVIAMSASLVLVTTLMLVGDLLATDLIHRFMRLQRFEYGICRSCCQSRIKDHGLCAECIAQEEKEEAELDQLLRDLPDDETNGA